MELKDIFNNNEKWATKTLERDPDFFKRLEEIQRPKFLWIGCSDSRVPANQITGLEPGEVFVHRNVGNLVLHTDLNFLSVVQFAIDVLKVEDIIVCGHYGCGGVNAALSQESFGLVDNWVRHIKDIVFINQKELGQISDLKQRQNRLTELNVSSQVLNLCHSSVVQEAWAKNQKLKVHGLVYGLSDGKLKDLNISIDSNEKLNSNKIFNLG